MWRLAGGPTCFLRDRGLLLTCGALRAVTLAPTSARLSNRVTGLYSSADSSPPTLTRPSKTDAFGPPEFTKLRQLLTKLCDTQAAMVKRKLRGLVVVSKSTSNDACGGQRKRRRRTGSDKTTSKTDEQAKEEAKTLRRITLTDVLSAYCNSCSRTGEDALALHKLNYYRKMWLSTYGSDSRFCDVKLMHSYIRLCATSGKVDDLASVWKVFVEESHVEPDNQAVMLLFQCLAKLDQSCLSSDFVLALVSKFRDKDWNEVRDNATFYYKTDVTEFYKGVKMFFPSTEFCDEPTPAKRPYFSELLPDLPSCDTSSLQSPLQNLNMDKAEDLIATQIEREKDDAVKIPTILPHEKREEIVMFIEEQTNEWRKVLQSALQKKMEWYTRDKSFSDMTPMSTFPFLTELHVDDYVEIVVRHVVQVLRTSEFLGPPVTKMQFDLGTAVMEKVQMERLAFPDEAKRQEHASLYKEYLRWFSDPTAKEHWCPREAYVSVAKSRSCNVLLDSSQLDWPFAVKLSIGRQLLSLIMSNLHVKVDERDRIVLQERAFHASPTGSFIEKRGHIQSNATFPVFFRVFRPLKDRMEIEQLKPLPNLARLFSLEKVSDLEFATVDLPMVVPPVPWLSTRVGGYLTRSPCLMRVGYNKIWESLQCEDKLLPILDSLTQLGSTPWIINKPVLDLAIDVFTRQEKYLPYLGGLSIPMHEQHIVPPELDPTIARKVRSSEELLPDEIQRYREFLTMRSAHFKVKAECYSLWRDLLYRLSIANFFRNDVIYFPHNIDFRGRVYPIALYLNHMGSDLTRSLLHFAEGKPLGPNGLRWIKLHTINLTGHKKKESVENRLQYAEDVMPDILDSANDPFGGNRWWLKSDEPWQTLAACIELKAIHEWPGKVEDFVTHLPIHQDGSCNGLQHYAALGRDVLGAQVVNVLPAELPQDVYSEIAAIVEKRRHEDAASGVKIAQVLDGFIERKVVKQTVMTTVYGVTRFGARLQIARQLKYNDEFPAEHIEEAAYYLTKKVFESLNEMFRGSQEIQAWFMRCADVFINNLNRSIEWQTPLGLFVRQPYYKTEKQVTAYREDEHSISDPLMVASYPAFSKLNGLKQKNGFAPNFIHSLDSTHMMLTSLYMWHQGLTFASVHDCYWTHPCAVEKMNEICREQFLRLHSFPVLEKLSQSFMETLEQSSLSKEGLTFAKAKLTFAAIPQKGELNLEEVKRSVYFFS